MKLIPILILPLILAVAATAILAAEKDHDHGDDPDHHPKSASTTPTSTPSPSHPHKHRHTDDDDHGHAHDNHHDHGDAAQNHGEHDDHDQDENAHADEVKLTDDAIRRNGIQVGPVTRQSLNATFTAPARVAFNAEAVAHVGSAVSGRAVEIKVKTGDSVKKGDELLVIESPELGEAQSDFLQKRAIAGVAQAGIEPLKNAHERATKLYEQTEGIALAEVQKREAEYKAAEGQALTQKAAAIAALNKLLLLGMTKDEVKELEKTGALTPRYVVRAPISGQVIQREVTTGELVTPEKDALLVLADMSTLWLWADVPEVRLGEVGVGTPTRAEVAALKKSFEGTVSHVSASLDSDTRTGRVRIDVPNENNTLRSGMFAKVQFTSSNGDGGEAVLAVPEEAVQTIEGSPSVFVPVEGEANTFAKRDVKIGEPVGGMVPVFSGLKEGEQIVTRGTFILKADLGKSGASHGH
ncbi:MAG: efflux RND transporter periplasmic adaptor subunit [Tepidisphaeraceae bacterium]